jgi:hypothetical protein
MSNFDMYQNSGYVNKRNRKRTLILDIDDSTVGDTHLGAGTDFNIKLFEPLIIDKHSEVYLDNCLTYNSNIAQTISSSAFCLKINEFNMNSNVASSSDNNTIFNSLVIPNDHKTVDNNHGAVVHKGKKFNYVCDINPQTLHSISGKITDLSGQPMFHGTNTDAKFTYALSGITSGNLDKIISNKGSFTGIENVTTSSSGTFIAYHSTSATTLHFSTRVAIGVITGATTDIKFNGLGGGTPAMTGTLTLTNSVGENPNLILLQNPGRFIAEFSIISV